MEHKDYGLIIPRIETREEGAEHLLLGAEWPVINNEGDWTSFWPEGERQNRNGIETYGCTVWATLNAIEAAIYQKTGIRVNYSDRYLANVARYKGILNPKIGADPHKIAELIRTVAGCLRDDRSPWSNDIKSSADFYDIQNISELMREGQQWYNEWELEHRWVFQLGSPEDKEVLLKDALTKGPVCVSVVAWPQDTQGIYTKPSGSLDNHFTGLIRYDGDHPISGDSYPESEGDFEKKLAPLYNFSIAKVFYLNPAKSKLDWVQSMINWIKSIVPFLQKQVEEKVKENTPISPLTRNSINLLAKAIEVYESVNVALNNPGGLRYSPFQDGYIVQSTTGKKLATFATYERGWQALTHQIMIVCNGTSPAYNTKAKGIGLPDCSYLTLSQFLHIYAPRYENETERYVAFIENRMGVSRNVKMGDLI